MAKCFICRGVAPIFGSYSSDLKKICHACKEICNNPEFTLSSDIKKYWDENNKRIQLFKPTKKIRLNHLGDLEIDEEHRMFSVPHVLDNKHERIVYLFNEIESVDYNNENAQTETVRKGGVSRAVIGGMIAGPAGAVVGSATSKTETHTYGGGFSIRVTYNSIPGIVNKEYFGCSQNVLDFFLSCMNDDTNTVLSPADEIMKYKQLLDMEAITEEEYEAKKKQLLDL